MASSEVFANVQTLVHDAWEFLIPPTIRLAVALAIFLCFVPSPGINPETVHIDASNTRLINDVVGALERFKLTAFVPLGVLALVVLTAYMSNRLMFSIGSLIPINVRMDTLAAVEKNLGLIEIWRRYPGVEHLSGVLDIVEDKVTKAKLENAHSALFRVDRIKEQLNVIGRRQSFLKFLLIWTVISWFIGWLHSVPLSRSIPLLLGCLALLVILLILTFGQLANQLKEELIAKIDAARSLLTVDGPKPVLPSSEGYQRIEEYLRNREKHAKHGWWTLTVVRPPLMAILKGFHWR